MTPEIRFQGKPLNECTDDEIHRLAQAFALRKGDDSLSLEADAVVVDALLAEFERRGVK